MRLTYQEHAWEPLLERGFIQSDVLHVLKNGMVFDEPEESTRSGLFRYRIEGRSPNSGGRTIRLVVIPEPKRLHLKVITVMWATN